MADWPPAPAAPAAAAALPTDWGGSDEGNHLVIPRAGTEYYLLIDKAYRANAGGGVVEQWQEEQEEEQHKEHEELPFRG